MTTRDQLNKERIDALIKILEAEGVLETDEAGELIHVGGLADANQTATEARKRRGKLESVGRGAKKGPNK